MPDHNQSFFFYDLETSGFNPRSARIMQFAGQRTSLDLKPTGKPYNHLITMSNDVLPDPGAVLLTGITPQMTVSEGMSEAEFLALFHKEIATPGTIFVGYNTVRFDDEFMRYLHYRNFYDPYEWHWVDGRSRWDVLDVVRMTRALRPDGIKWPVAADGSATNRLEDIAKLNKLLHDNAHDALSDVGATIGLATLIRKQQPKLFDHLLTYRDKKRVQQLAAKGQPFVYTSGKYPSKYVHTTVVSLLGEHPKKQGVFVYDLRVNPVSIARLSIAEIISRWQHRCDERPCPHPRFPVKTMQFNRCPAVAPLGVIDTKSADRIAISMSEIHEHFEQLTHVRSELLEKVLAATKEMDKAQTAMFATASTEPDSALYDGFLPESDKQVSLSFRSAEPATMPGYIDKFDDPRLKQLLPRYIARNYPKALTTELRNIWETYRHEKLLSGGEQSIAAKYFEDLAVRASSPKLTKAQQYLLEELRLWGESILPTEQDG